MIDLKLNGAHDLEKVGGDLVLVTGAEEVAQNVKIRLLTMKYEWIFNTFLGVQWISSGGMFDPRVPKREKELTLRRVILETPGVLKLRSFLFRVDNANRAAVVEFTASTVYGLIEMEITI
jgi:hypothetical protein